MKGFFNYLIKTLSVFCITAFSFCTGQTQENMKPVGILAGDEKKMYEILKECIAEKAINKSALHYFSECVIHDTSDKMTIGAYYYDENYYHENYYSPSSATYYASITFKKTQPEPDLPRGRGSVKTPSYGKPQEATAPPQFYLVVKDANDKRLYSSSYVLQKKSNQPFFTGNYYSESNFSKNVYNGNKVDKDLYPQNFDHAVFVNTFFIIASQKGKYGIQSSKKETMIPFEYESLQVFDNNFLAQKDSKFFLINSKNEKISQEMEKFPSLFEYSTTVNNIPQTKNIFLVKINGKQTFLDRNFNVLKPLVYDKIEYFNTKQLMLLATIDKKQVLVDYYSFKELTPRYDKITNLDNERLLIESNGKKGLADFTGKIILECLYDNIEIPLGSDYYTKPIKLLIEKDKKLALYANGQFLTKFEYDKISFRTNFLIVKKDNRYGTLDMNGNVLIACKYDSTQSNNTGTRLEFIKNGKAFEINENGEILKN
ncbi:WG repeat-containing protein [Chryseobacterium daecheongense]|uniref:WG repeat protein n=1 Tax=Chryseobacterium daecheongense TaxID=192389 RepID=A0A3N0W6Y4_9FLAO|nr:WG repeat-containing protein [Chryseobacterium daecheongense]ROI00773.1 hypothetical protein EGI05_07840 [Chryseobacterium daecheongense]TDX90241.1 WG repeat protein [Chryseobacterium daecheongense]